MKKNGIILLFLICNTLFAHAQKETAPKAEQREYLIEQIDKSIKDIQKDLQEKKLQYNNELVDKYLSLSEKYNQAIGINKEPQLIQIAFVIKPKEIEPQREAYEKAKEELQKLLKSYPEYVYLDSIQQRAINEDARKSISASRNNFFNRLAAENKEYRPLRDKEQKALRLHQIAAARHMLNEYKSKQEVMPTNIIDYNVKRTILDTNPALNQLSIEIALLEDLLREQLRKYQTLKYNVVDDKIIKDNYTPQ